MQFGDRLAQILFENDMTQTDLARLIWDERYVDKRGYIVVKGKDLVSSWVNNRRLPSRRNHRHILLALNVTEKELPLHRVKSVTRTPLAQRFTRRNDTRDLIDAINRLTQAIERS